MRIVARQALPFSERHVDLLLALRFFGLGMAPEAEVLAVCNKKLLRFGGMGVMTVQTSLLVLHRRVARGCLFVQLRVALEAELLTGPQK
jgi:hypothetical protein